MFFSPFPSVSSYILPLLLFYFPPFFSSFNPFLSFLSPFDLLSLYSPSSFLKLPIFFIFRFPSLFYLLPIFLSLLYPYFSLPVYLPSSPFRFPSLFPIFPQTQFLLPSRPFSFRFPFCLFPPRPSSLLWLILITWHFFCLSLSVSAPTCLLSRLF